MTKNQIDYKVAVETHRHNLETEKETSRNNMAVLAETNRHNVVIELETYRHNLADENIRKDANIINSQHYARMDAETKRHNQAVEAETNRSNLVKEQTAKESNQIAWTNTSIAQENANTAKYSAVINASVAAVQKQQMQQNITKSKAEVQNIKVDTIGDVVDTLLKPMEVVTRGFGNVSRGVSLFTK